MNIEHITPDHHMVSLHDELLQRCILRENTYTLKFSEGSSYNATAELSKIRCMKDKHHYVDHIYYMIHALPLSLQCSEAIFAYARLIKFNPSISACAKLACTRCRWT